MSSWEPVDIDKIDCDAIADEDDKWGNNLMNNIEERFEELRQYNRNFNQSRDEATKEDASIFVDVTRNNIEELVANEIYDKLTILFNNTLILAISMRELNYLRKFGN